MTKFAFLFDPDNDWLSASFSQDVFDRADWDIATFHAPEQIRGYDVVVILGYTKILPPEFLDQNQLNVVVHESALPDGKGFAPVQWQILEGKTEIPVCLIEATSQVDGGDILMTDVITLTGYELYDDIRAAQAAATQRIVRCFLEVYPNYSRQAQHGDGTVYPRRKAADGELDINQTLRSQFDLLRIGNNDGWPAFFEVDGRKYVLKIYSDDS